MKIVHVNLGGPAITVDGIASVVNTLVATQRHRGDDVLAFTDERYDARGARKSVLTALELRREILAAQPDIVHMHSVYRPAHAVLGVFLRRAHVPYVISPHSGLALGSRRRQRWRKATFIALFERRLLGRANAVHCLSAVEGEDVRVVAPSATVVVVPNPGPAAPTETAAVPPAEHLLTLCRFDVEQKGLDVLVDIARLMPGTRFRVFGEVDINDPAGASALIAAAPANITFEPPVRGADKDVLLRSARAYIQPSRWEGQSISVLEALAAGVPCIVSRYVARTLGDELASLTIVVDDDPQLAATEIAASLERTTELAHAASIAQQIVLSRYAPEAICDELDVAYAGAIARRSSLGAARVMAGQR